MPLFVPRRHPERSEGPPVFARISTQVSGRPSIHPRPLCCHSRGNLRSHFVVIPAGNLLLSFVVIRSGNQRLSFVVSPRAEPAVVLCCHSHRESAVVLCRHSHRESTVIRCRHSRRESAVALVVIAEGQFSCRTRRTWLYPPRQDSVGEICGLSRRGSCDTTTGTWL